MGGAGSAAESGGPGIRTLGDGDTATAVFKTAALGHYASPPGHCPRAAANCATHRILGGGVDPVG